MKPQIVLTDLPACWNENGEHYYQSTNGLWYPSVTTFLKQVVKEPGLEAWKNRVGLEAAGRAAKRGATRGTAVHSLLEAHLLGQPVDKRGIMPTYYALFTQIRDLLDLHFSELYLLEKALYSDYFQLAGTPDLIGIWRGILTIIDFKTANMSKRESDVQKHFLQTAAYKLLFEETMKHKQEFTIGQLVVIIANENGTPAQVFTAKPDEYVKMFERLWMENHPVALTGPDTMAQLENKLEVSGELKQILETF